MIWAPIDPRLTWIFHDVRQERLRPFLVGVVNRRFHQLHRRRTGRDAIVHEHGRGEIAVREHLRDM